MAAVGVCLGYFVCYGSTKLSSTMSWRAPYIIQVAISIILLVCCFVLPESPRWLISQGKREETIRSIRNLDISTAEVEMDFLREENQQNPSLSLWNSLMLAFRGGYRARTLLALFILGMVQLSGIDGVLYVSKSMIRHKMRSNLNSTPQHYLPKQAFQGSKHHS
jgi:MFS family permease